MIVSDDLWKCKNSSQYSQCSIYWITAILKSISPPPQAYTTVIVSITFTGHFSNGISPGEIQKAMKLLLFLDRSQVSTTLSFRRPDTSVNRPIPPVQCYCIIPTDIAEEGWSNFIDLNQGRHHIQWYTNKTQMAVRNRHIICLIGSTVLNSLSSGPHADPFINYSLFSAPYFINIRLNTVANNLCI